jgi:predicted permease
VDAIFQRVGDTLVPLAMFAVGLRVRLRPPKERGALVLGLVFKMLVAPAAAWALARALGAPRDILTVATLEAGMPSQISAGALAMLHGFAPELSAALVGYGIALSMLTVPAIAHLLQ